MIHATSRRRFSAILITLMCVTLTESLQVLETSNVYKEEKVQEKLPAGPTPTPLYSIPILKWQPRSDWIDVTKHGAKGDGKTDDSAAIQSAIALLSSCTPAPLKNATGVGSTLYFPAGTFLIKSTLVVHNCHGFMLVGTGATSIIRWGGIVNGTMFVSNGTTFGHVNGLVWDGQHRAMYGYDYNSTGESSLFETRQLHRNEHFIGFNDAAIAIGVWNGPAGADGYEKLRLKKEAAEGVIQNCIFEDSFKGIGLENFNDYDWAIDSCTFVDNSFGIYAAVHRDSNWDVHMCRFERSTISDLSIAAEASNARHIVSVGSAQFLTTINWPGHPGAIPNGSGGGPYHAPLHIHDCRIVNWTAPSAITFGLRGPLTISNVEFEGGPQDSYLVTMKQALEINMTGVLIEGGIIRDGSHVNHTSPGFSDSDPNTVTYHIAGANLTSSSVITPDTQFTQSSGVRASVPLLLFDCSLEPFGANSTNAQRCDDRADAIQACINAAAKSGTSSSLAMAYLPKGTWQICKPLTLPSGYNYSFAGAGAATELQFEPEFWPTPANPDMFEQPSVLEVDPAVRGLRVENIHIGRYQNHPAQDNSYTIRLRVNRSKSEHRTGVDIYLDWIFGDGTYNASTNGILLEGLTPADTVRIGYLDHPINVNHSANATVLVDFMTGGRLTVSGNEGGPRTGFLGVKMFAGLAFDYAMIINGPQDLAVGYCYIESVSHHLLLQGVPPPPPPPPPPGVPCSSFATKFQCPGDHCYWNNKTKPNATCNELPCSKIQDEKLCPSPPKCEWNGTNCIVSPPSPVFPGRITIRGVKVHSFQGPSSPGCQGMLPKGSTWDQKYAFWTKTPACKNTSIWLETKGWSGALLYIGAQFEYCDACGFLNKVNFTSTEAKECKCFEAVNSGGKLNVTVLGSSVWPIGGGNNSLDYSPSAVHGGNGIDFTGYPNGSAIQLGTTLGDWNDPASPWFNGSLLAPDIRGRPNSQYHTTGNETEAFRISNGLDLLTMLGIIDMRLYH